MKGQLFLIYCMFGLAACAPAVENEVLGTVERDRLELVAEAHEPIVEVLVREGDHVARDQLLLRQELGGMQARLDQARAQMHQAERRLDELIRGPRAQEIQQARANLEAAESSSLTQQRELARVQELVTARLLSDSALDQARTARDLAQATRKQTQAALQLLLDGTRSEEIDQARAAADAAKAVLAELELLASRFALKAPRAGVIEALPYKLGERPPAGQPLAIMLADGLPYARVYVPESLRAQYAAGSAVNVRVDGWPQAFAGRVRFVSAQAAFTPYYALTQKDRSRLSYLVEVELTGGDAQALPTGIPAQVTPAPAP